MTERIIPAADKMLSFSDINGFGFGTQTIYTQDGKSHVFKLSLMQMRYALSRLEAILAKFDESNAITD